MDDEFKTTLKRIVAEKKPSMIFTIRESALESQSQFKSVAKELRAEIGGSLGDWKDNKELILNTFIIPALAVSRQEALSRKLPRKGSKEARLYGANNLATHNQEKIQARAYAHTLFTRLLNYAFEPELTNECAKAREDWANMLCPNCNRTTKCSEYSYAKLYLNLNDYQNCCEPDSLLDIHIVERARLCLTCYLPFHTVEIDQSYITELVELRNKLTTIKTITNS